MNDILESPFLVAALVALSTLLGAGVSAVINYKVTSRQVDGARRQSEAQLAHATQEAWVERQVAHRQSWIGPLQESISESLMVTGRISTQFGRLWSAAQAGDTREMDQIWRDLESSPPSWSERGRFTAEFRNSDELLRSMLSELWEQWNGAQSYLMTATKSAVDAVRARDLQGAEKYRAAVNRIFGELNMKLVAVNRRLEYLASGRDLFESQQSPLQADRPNPKSS